MKCKDTDQDLGEFSPFVTSHAQVAAFSRSGDRGVTALRRAYGSGEKEGASGLATQRTIAACLGMTQATVSRALRGDLSLPSTTRRLIVDTAREMGYCRNSHVSVLVEHIRAGRKVNQQGCIAILVDSASESDWLNDETSRLQYHGFMEQADRRGYRTECFCLRGQNGVKDVDRILTARGIVGVLFAKPLAQPGTLNLHWERYAMATFDSTESPVHLNRVSVDRQFNLNHALAELKRRGFRRIGLSLPESTLKGSGSQWMGAFLASQLALPENQRIPAFVHSSGADSFERFKAWFTQWQPEALLCRTGEEALWIEQIGLSLANDVAVVCLDRPEGSRFSGMEENSVKVGAITCDLVVNQLMHNEQGLPSEPRHILVEGSWKEGAVIPRPC